MKKKNRSRFFFDDDEVLVADILLQIPHIIFESESRLPFNWGFRRARSAIDRSLSSHPKRKRTEVSCEKKKEDRLKMVDGLTHQRELLKSEIGNVTGLPNTLTDVKSETKLNLVTAMVKAKAESGEQVHPHPHLQQSLPFLRRHSAETSALVPPSTSGSIVVYPMGSFVVMPHLNLSSSMETLRPNLNPPLNVALYFDPTQSKRAAAAQARKKRSQIYRVKKPKVVQVPLSSLLVGR